MAVISPERDVEELEAVLEADMRAHCASFAALLRTIAEHDRIEAWTRAGAKDEAAYLMRKFDHKWATAKNWVRCARLLARHPELAGSLANGEASPDRIIGLAEFLEAEDARNTSPLGPFDQPDQPEPSSPPPPDDPCPDDPRPDGCGSDDPSPPEDPSPSGLGAGVGATAQQLAVMAARLRAANAAEATRLHRRRRVVFHHDVANRHVHFDGDLFDDDAALFLAAFREHRRQTKPNPETNTYDPFPVQNADALVAMAAAMLQLREQITVHPMLFFHGDARLLAGDDGWAETSDHSPLAVDTFRRYACACHLNLVGTDPAGNPLFLGRSARGASWKQTEMVRRRDGGCRMCGQTLFTQVHHLRFWQRDMGPTDITNLASFCHRCHRLLHEGGWHVEGNPYTELTFIGPHSTFTTKPHPQPDAPPPPTRRSRRATPDDPTPTTTQATPTPTKTTRNPKPPNNPPPPRTTRRQPPDPPNTKGKHARERTRTTRLF